MSPREARSAACLLDSREVVYVSTDISASYVLLGWIDRGDAKEGDDFDGVPSFDISAARRSTSPLEAMISRDALVSFFVPPVACAGTERRTSILTILVAGHTFSLIYRDQSSNLLLIICSSSVTKQEATWNLISPQPILFTSCASIASNAIQ